MTQYAPRPTVRAAPLSPRTGLRAPHAALAFGLRLRLDYITTPSRPEYIIILPAVVRAASTPPNDLLAARSGAHARRTPPSLKAPEDARARHRPQVENQIAWARRQMEAEVPSTTVNGAKIADRDDFVRGTLL
jgi:hypothetical protein